jgi:hypothetical protein
MIAPIEPNERSWWQILWLLSQVRTACDIATVTGYSPYWTGWHASQRLRVPDHVHLLFLPPYSPELQPAEHLWPLTNAPPINRHFASTKELEEAQLAHCAALQRQPERIRSTTLFHWWPQRRPLHPVVRPPSFRSCH